MTADKNRQIILAARPKGAPKDSDFRLVETPIPSVADGQFLSRTIYLSLDPYMRGRMNDGASYAAPVPIGGVMEGGGVSRVIESAHPDYAVGDIVTARSGWQDYAVSDGADARKVDPALAPISTAVGVLGMPGFTAYAGLLELGKPKAGETVVVSAASGAVGGVVGQIAGIKGARAVGIAGTPEKCKYVTETLGFAACVNHRAPDFAAQLAAACPDGIDVYFENVGGAVLAAVIPLLSQFSRIPVCGMIAHYNASGLPDGPNMLPHMMMTVLTRRVMLRGFIVSDFAERFPDFLRDVGQWVREGKVQYREDVAEGLENAVTAFQGLLQGRNFGKQLVRVSPE